MPFRIANEATDKRYLTGADFDIEIIQPIGSDIWFGDEFGPYLIKTDITGKVLAVFETLVDGKPARSPDHFAVSTPAVPGGRSPSTCAARAAMRAWRASKDGKFLYPLLEGPLWDADKKEWEKADGKEVLRILEFSVADGKWTGRHWKYPLELDGNNIGDFNMIDATTGLIIERDNGEGTADRACPEASRRRTASTSRPGSSASTRSRCGANAGGFVRKIGYIDLMDIDDPKKLAKQGGRDGKLAFPFVTIEDVDVVNADAHHRRQRQQLPLLGRPRARKQDDNEFILLDVADFLKAK